MTGFQAGVPNVTVMLTFGHSLVWKRSDGGKKPLAECRDGLLTPFLDGMIEMSARKGQIVDGHELSYGYRDAAAFVQARDTIKIEPPLSPSIAGGTSAHLGWVWALA